MGQMRHSLAFRLLWLVILFMMGLAVLMYVPAMAEFRKGYLEERLIAAQTAALALEEVPGGIVSPDLEREILDSAKIRAVIVYTSDSRQLVLRTQLPTALTARYDIRNPSFVALNKDALVTLLRKGVGVIQVRGNSISPRHDMVEIVMDESYVYDAMVGYSKTVALGLLLIAALTSMLIYLALLIFVVRPMQNMKEAISRFRRDPKTPTDATPSGRTDEIGLVEHELARMQNELRLALRQKENLANLGMAVSKINHDLRNILATARLSADRIARMDDPTAQTVAQRLTNAVDRAIKLCERTLEHGRAEEPLPISSNFQLRPLVVEVLAELATTYSKGVQTDIAIDDTLTLYADPDQVWRVIMNICRNAMEAMGDEGTLSVEAKQNETTVTIRIADTAGGIPADVQENLFKPFAGGARVSGTGLGMTIVKELAEANKGEVRLEKTDASGSVFCIILPAGKE